MLVMYDIAKNELSRARKDHVLSESSPTPLSSHDRTI